VTGCDFLWAVCGVCGAVCFVWRTFGGVRAVMFAQSAVVAAVRDVVRACAGLVCLYAVCECAMCDAWLVVGVRSFWVTRAMMLTWCCGGWGLSRRVCL
jgi:hypothetical protein